jgi:hypothetical protein
VDGSQEDAAVLAVTAALAIEVVIMGLLVEMVTEAPRPANPPTFTPRASVSTSAREWDSMITSLATVMFASFLMEASMVGL